MTYEIKPLSGDPKKLEGRWDHASRLHQQYAG